MKTKIMEAVEKFFSPDIRLTIDQQGNILDYEPLTEAGAWTIIDKMPLLGKHIDEVSFVGLTVETVEVED